MLPVARKRLLLWTATLALALFTGGVLARLALTGLALRALLRSAGAAEVKFEVAAASPWRLVVENMDFRVHTQPFAARRVTLSRDHWWTPSLGSLRIEQARMPVTIDGSDVNPWAWATYENGATPALPPAVPLDEISVDGQLVIKAAAVPDQALTVRLDARFVGHKTWTGRATVDGPGLSVKGEGSFDPATQALDFRLPEIALDLKSWQNFVQRLVLLPGGTWQLEGQAGASAAGRWAGKVFAATASVRLRDGRLQNTERAITAEGIDVDLEFTDLDRFLTKPGTLRIRELRAGRFSLQAIAAEFAFAGSEQLVVSHAALTALGGRVALEPFKYFPNTRELDATVVVDGIDVAEVLALTQNLPAQATGRVAGRFPLHLDAGGLRLGTGWLALKPGVAAELRLDAAGLLTRGLAAGSAGYAVLQKVESGLLKLRLNELRLDIRPPDAPPGRSATLHVAGEPLDPTVKAPVILDLNVNGPLEQLLNLGLDARVNFGAGK